MTAEAQHHQVWLWEGLLGKLLHHSIQDHTLAHFEGCQWCNGTDLGCSSHMEHRPQLEQLAWGMHKVPQKGTMPWTHLQVANPSLEAAEELRISCN